MTNHVSSSVIVSVLPTTTSGNAPTASPRGIKRSRSPEIYGDVAAGVEGDDGRLLLKTQAAV